MDDRTDDAGASPEGEARGAPPRGPGEPGPERGGASDATVATITDDVEGELATAHERIAELDDRWRRAAADLQNLRRRLGDEIERARTEERTRVLFAWASIVDDLERALANAADDDGPVITGLRAILDRATETMRRFGHPSFGDAGDAFDPNRHHAVATAPADDRHPPGTIVEVQRRGYGGDGGVLRPADVVVSRAPD
ncbi:MAG: nucleotide exchange factor GrpE [Actinomycetota bacterium]